jgi:hypothetical protein
MPSNYIAFTWQVPRGGHRWHDAGVADGQPDPVLIEQAPPGLAHRRQYDPFADAPALYREFARTAPTREGITAFADTWGPLWGWDGFADPRTTARRAELFSTWRRAISEMKQAVDLWDILLGLGRLPLDAADLESGQAALKRLIDWQEDPEGFITVSYDSHRGLPVGQKLGDDGYVRTYRAIASNRYGSEGLAGFQRNELSGPARAFLCWLANENLRGRVSPRLFPDVWMQPQVVKRLPLLASLRLVPHSLFGCLWLQFAQAMNSDREQRLCQGCRTWFDLGKGNRSDRAYCSDGCRKRAYRQRQEEARRLSSEGKSVKDIAKALDAKPASVKAWIKGTGGTSTKGA